MLLPFSHGELLAEIHKTGVIQQEQYCNEGTLIQARVPLPLASRLAPLVLDDFDYDMYNAEAVPANGDALVA